MVDSFTGLNNTGPHALARDLHVFQPPSLVRQTNLKLRALLPAGTEDNMHLGCALVVGAGGPAGDASSNAFE